MPGPSRRSAAAARHAPRRTQPLPPVSRGAPWILSVGVSSASRGGGAERATPAGILGTGALRLHIHTQQQLLYLIDFLNILNFLAAISPWHQTSPNSQIKVEIWICKDRYLHQDNSDRQPGHDAICGDIGSVCNANYRCQIIIFITLGRGHYTDSAAAIRQSAPHHCYHSKHAAATDILGIYLLYRPASSPEPSNFYDTKYIDIKTRCR